LVVVIVNWNGRHHLPDCLGSLAVCGYQPLQVVLVDNGSSDGSVAYVRQAFPSVEILALRENLRWAGANNLLIRRLLQEGIGRRLLLLLNNDTVVLPGSLQRLVAALVREPHAWAATPRICYAADPGRAWYDGGRIGSRSGWIRHAGIRQPVAKLPVQPKFVDYGSGCALLLGAEALQKVGELDQSYHFYGEDTDYCLRMKAAGGRVLHVPEALILHKVSASLGSGSPRKAYLRSRSHILLLRRHWPRRRWPLVVICQLAYYAALAVWHVWSGQPKTALAALQGALDELRGAAI
jgi:GT2 family glycosyltransferase